MQKNKKEYDKVERVIKQKEIKERKKERRKEGKKKRRKERKKE
jgi:hypothetical protein